ncbi:MAG: ATP-binding protein [Vicinamibacteria bacterium]
MTSSAAEPDLERLAETARLALLGRLADAVAHDVATPLASIALRAESLLRKTKAPDFVPGVASTFERHLASIHEDTFRMSRMLDALRGSRAAPAALVVRELLEAAAAASAQAAGARGLRLEIETGVLPPLVRGSAGRLRLALLALLRNAIEASEPGGRVVLGARATGDALELSVEDGGPGLPAEVEARLFSPFNSGRAAEHGLGLGLFLCDRIAREHGGELQLLRRQPRGARARLTLPLAGIA